MVISIVVMLGIIFTNSNEQLVLKNMTIMPSLPNIFDPKILLNKKDERITDLMGNNEYVLIRENVTTIASHKVFFRESIPRSNVTSNGLTVVLLHDKHTEATGGTGCCSGLWLWLGTLHRLGKEGFHVIAIDLPGYGFSEGIQLDIRESAIFMKELIVLFKLQKIILVSPSTSIKVSIPFALSQPEHLDGLVIPSPTTTLKITNDASMSELGTPTLITFGADDTTALSDYEKVLSKIPNHKLIKVDARTVDDGVKLVYLDDPSHFHDHVIQFAKSIST